MTKKRAIETGAVLLHQENIENKIYLIRGKKVMIDSELAELYGVPTKGLNLAVKRNLSRFPSDFMFQLNEKESQSLRFQNETSNKGRGGRRYLPYVFTQEGVAMLSSVLNSERAIQVNIQIMRAFVKLRELMISHKGLAQKINELEKKFNDHDKSIALIFRAIKELLESPPVQETSKEGIGFHVR
ncbi:MAG: ORF6N domain-containing protein [Candidatus Omnitrophica bacterium]|nr:ORF6N domain-containing protein [Candidatus Omnitrophota bacterium]